MIESAALLAWTHTLVLWTAANYLFIDSSFEDSAAQLGARPKINHLLPRAIANVAGAIMAGWLISSWLIGVLFVIFGILLSTLRSVVPQWRMVTRELTLTGLFAFGSVALIVGGQLQLPQWILMIRLPGVRLASIGLISALFVFTIHGGTYIVRGILKIGGVSTAADPKELKRGRLIGALERAVLFGVLVAGSYEALGFVVAAKGLIRSRDFEASRDLTEYFLVGSLASVAVALATGTAARWLLQAYW